MNRTGLSRILQAAGLALPLLAGSCAREPETRAGASIDVTVIGSFALRPNPLREALGEPDRLLAGATSRGLVRLDPTGQLVPDLAERWRVSDDGLSYIFRLGEARWSNGDPVLAKDVAVSLDAILRAGSRHSLKPYLLVIEGGEAIAAGRRPAGTGINAAMDDIVELRLVAPRPGFLSLLAQPDLALLPRGKRSVAGSYRINKSEGGIRWLKPSAEDAPAIRLTAQPDAASAIRAFLAGRAAMVTGGDAGSLFLARRVTQRGMLRVDPALGVYGYRFVSRRAPLDRADVRRALSMAIDRQQLATDMAQPTVVALSGMAPPALLDQGVGATPAWASASQAERLAAARALLVGVPRLELKVALPQGTGHRAILSQVAENWARLGVRVRPVAFDAPDADLRLVDMVARADLATLFLRPFACTNQPQPCSMIADVLLDQARRERDPARRAILLGQAEQLLIDEVPIIPLTTPVRWSLVRPGLTGFSENRWAHHPLSWLAYSSGR